MEKRKKGIIISIILFILLLTASITIVGTKLITTYVVPTVKGYIAEYQQDMELEEKLEKVFKLRDKGEYYHAIAEIDRLLLEYEDADLYSEKGYMLIVLGRYDEGVKVLEKAIELDPKHDTALNNLSWGYNELEEYEKALEYINRGLKLGDNPSIEHVNKGNALYGLGKYEEAIKSYNTAIRKDNKSSYAYNGKGISYHALGEYKNVPSNIVKSTKLNGTIAESDLYYILDSYYQLGQKDKMENYIELYLDESESEIKPLINLGSIFEIIGAYDKALEYYYIADEKLLSKGRSEGYLGDLLSTDDMYVSTREIDSEEYLRLIESIGYANYQLDNHKKSLKYFNKVLNAPSQSIESSNPRIFNVFNLVYLKRYEEADTLAKSIISREPKNEFAYNALGNVYMEQFFYDKATEQFEKAIELDPYYKEAHTSKAYSLFFNKQYEECIEYSEEILDLFPKNLDAYWYIADSYSAIYEEEKAIENYKKALEISPKNETLFMRLAWEYFGLQEYDNSKIYVDSTLDINPEHEEAKGLREVIDQRMKPLKDRVVEFVEENYLYLDDIENYEEKVEKFKEKVRVNSKDIEEFINDIKLKGDRFTSTITTEDYAMYLEYEDLDAVYEEQVNKEIHYIRVATFNNSTYTKFRSAIDSIENTKDKKLIIDLRSNGGGIIDSANDMLDIFLPKGEMSVVRYREEDDYIYESNPTAIEFKEIFVLVDRNSASGSELLALGLKKNLDNVTIIGETTVGKGVGQRVFNDKENEVMIYLVSFYWDVQGENVLDKGIEPDVYYDFSEDKRNGYMDEVLD